MFKRLKYLAPVKIKRLADFKPRKPGVIETLKKSCYCVVEGYSITGEAPKSFIRVYEYQSSQHCRKTSKGSWTLYIAKTGHKWYPLESTIEHLIARIGATIGLKMADSRLVQAGGQIRFLSKYFLGENQELVHGSNILATYLGDRELITDIETQRLEKEFYTLEETIKAIQSCFPDDQELILEKFFLMLFFDAWVGVQDRHYYNWGVVRHINNKHRPYFSPIFDSARGLFWNEAESKIAEWWQYKQLDQQVERKIFKSQPQFGLVNKPYINHFELVSFIWENGLLERPEQVKRLFSVDALKAVQKMIVSEFSPLLSENRLALIQHYLEKRHKGFYALLT